MVGRFVGGYPFVLLSASACCLFYFFFVSFLIVRRPTRFYSIGLGSDHLSYPSSLNCSFSLWRRQPFLCFMDTCPCYEVRIFNREQEEGKESSGSKPGQVQYFEWRQWMNGWAQQQASSSKSGCIFWYDCPTYPSLSFAHSGWIYESKRVDERTRAMMHPQSRNIVVSFFFVFCALGPTSSLPSRGPQAH